MSTSPNTPKNSGIKTTKETLLHIDNQVKDVIGNLIENQSR